MLLPKGNPVKEKIDPSKVVLPDALNKLRTGGFTGYLRFETGGGTGIVIFEQGRLISALMEGQRERLVATDALLRIFRDALTTPAVLDIYRLSPDLAMSIHALLHGDPLYTAQELKLLDIKALLGKLKQDQINGCLRIYTKDRIALIFYRAGNPVGFFHDGSTEIETTADTSMSVARLPGAKIDVLTTQGPEELMLVDLMASADIALLWNRVRQEVEAQRRREQQEQARMREQELGARRDKILALLRETAERHIGKMGGSLVEKEFSRAVGAGLPDPARLEAFYAALGKAAKLVAGASAVAAMEQEMKRGIAPLLK